jgi:hypothetical protein
VRLLPILVLVALLAASCGKGSESLASLDKTRTCLHKEGVLTGGPLDFVATTATGGALQAHRGANFVTIAFGETVADADNIDQAYRRFRSKNVGIDDVLRQQANVVMLWHAHPSDADVSAITGCLK